MSARRLPADDPIFSAGPGNLPDESEASQSYSHHKTPGTRATEPYNAQIQETNPIGLPDPKEEISAFLPKSVKHLTCWYWANMDCKYSDDECLYSHFYTGTLAQPPVQVQRGRKYSLLDIHFNSVLNLHFEKLNSMLTRNQDHQWRAETQQILSRSTKTGKVDAQLSVMLRFKNKSRQSTTRSHNSLFTHLSKLNSKTP